MTRCNGVCQAGDGVRLDVRGPLLARANQPRQATLYGKVKGASDCSIALILLVLTAPLVMIAALLVKLTSRGPVFYSQTRLGRGNKPFTIFKIRTMVHDCEKHSGPQWSKPGDSRVTPVGKFLRKSHIDELPQLWNVLRGDMSLVGPRPERPEFVPQLELALDRYRERLLVRPGVSGLAQVQLPPDTDLNSVRRKLAHDLCYVERMSFWLDLRILVCTALHMVGVAYSTSAWIFALPGGKPVVRAYEESLAKLVEQDPAANTASETVCASSQETLHPGAVKAPHVPDLQPA